MPGQTFASATGGSAYYGNQLSEVLRTGLTALVRFRNAADSQINFGKHRGNQVTWSIQQHISTPGGPLASEQVSLPIGQLAIQQGSLTVGEFGQGLSYSRFLEDVSKFEVKEALTVELTYDCALTLDREVWFNFKETPLQLSANANSNASVILWAATTTGTQNNVTQQNNTALTLAHCRSISNLMKGRNMPAYRGSDYYAIGRPQTFEGIQSGQTLNGQVLTVGDNLQSIHQYTPTGTRYIMEGEMGRYRNIRFVEQTNIGQGIGNTGLDPSVYSMSDMVPWVNNASDWVYFFSEDTVIEAIVVPEQIFEDIPHDGFRSKYVFWYYNGGFALTQFIPTYARVMWWNSLS